MFPLKMETDNDTFSSSSAVEIARLLRRAAERLADKGISPDHIEMNRIRAAIAKAEGR